MQCNCSSACVLKLGPPDGEEVGYRVAHSRRTCRHEHAALSPLFAFIKTHFGCTKIAFSTPISRLGTACSCELESEVGAPASWSELGSEVVRYSPFKKREGERGVGKFALLQAGPYPLAETRLPSAVCRGSGSGSAAVLVALEGGVGVRIR
jgi:hypothetical protein